MNAFSTNETLQLQVDPEHNALRLATVGLFAAIMIIAFFLSNAIIPSDGFNILAGLIAFGLAAIITRLADPILKRWWPSKRRLLLDAEGARLTLNGQIQANINADGTANVHYWKFKIPRRGRMPRGWFVVACAIQQDDIYLPVYAFASPAQTDALGKIKQFTELHSEKSKASAAKAESLRLAGEQRRLRLAEEQRWHDGGELTVDDFETFITRLNELYARWNS
ncbi:MAG: hypothetical protein GC179_07700 [Anaerolineaceae bacterium]|nr:hypothetical protein [Anaerolineaceae bacterium]